MKKRFSGTLVWLIIIVVLIIAGVGAYFAGAAVARAQDAAAAQARYAAVQTKLESAQSHVRSLQSVGRLLSANVWVYRAAVALDNRNFGIANASVAKAVVNLKGVDAAAAGLNRDAVASVQKEAGMIKISVATNLESQRSQLLQLADGISALAGQAK